MREEAVTLLEIKSPNIFKMGITVPGFLVLLIFGMAFGTNPVEAQPFAYVTNFSSNNVSVIDTATNMVVGPPIPVGTGPVDVAITPDGTPICRICIEPTQKIYLW